MSMDRNKMEQGIRLFLDGLSQGFEGDDQTRTPERVARAWAEDLVAGYALDPEALLLHTLRFFARATGREAVPKTPPAQAAPEAISHTP